MDKQTVTDQLDLLPEHLQREVYDFIEFLTMKYFEDGAGEDFDLPAKASAQADDNEELSDEVKALLDERIASYKANPENVIPWEEVKERLYKKYGWKR